MANNLVYRYSLQKSVNVRPSLKWVAYMRREVRYGPAISTHLFCFNTKLRLYNTADQMVANLLIH